MRNFRIMLTALCALAGLFPSVSRATLSIGSGLGTTHAGNLVANGSFEDFSPGDGAGNRRYWATGTSNTPFLAPNLWTTSGVTSNFGLWGNDGGPGPQYRLMSSDWLPDGHAGIYFGNGTGFFSQNPTNIAPGGEITFPVGTTVNSSLGGPAIIQQTVPTDLTPSSSYKLSFWISGQENATVQGNNTLSVMGFRTQNIEVGNPIHFLEVPNGILFGQSHLYEFTFTPLNPLLPVTLQFISWGQANFSAAGGPIFGTEVVMDDVIVNADVPEPVALGSVALSGVLLVSRRKRGARRTVRTITSD